VIDIEAPIRIGCSAELCHDNPMAPKNAKNEPNVLIMFMAKPPFRPPYPLIGVGDT